MQSTALIMQIECSVVVVGIRIGDRPSDMWMLVCSDWCRLIHIQRVVIEQRNNARDLRNREDRQQGCSKALDGANEPHRVEPLPPLYRRGQRDGLRQTCHTAKVFQAHVRGYVRGPTDRLDRQFRLGWSDGRSQTAD